MGKHLVTCNLDVNSIENAIKYLKNYEMDFMAKAENFNKTLTTIGYNEVVNICNNLGYMATNELSYPLASNYTISKSGTSFISNLELIGEECVFVEFGSGTIHNTSIGNSLHPDGTQLGYTIGSYNPDTTNVERGYWYYNGEIRYGVPTLMPLYTAYETMVSNIDFLASVMF